MKQARIPHRGNWRPMVVPPELEREGVKGYKLGQLRVLSQLAMVTAPDGSGEQLLTYIVSVSQTGRTCPTPKSMTKARKAFGMLEAEEDNHESGIARKLFMCVDPARRVDCECKSDETTIEREDGYKYQVEDGGVPCNAAAHELLGYCAACVERATRPRGQSVTQKGTA